MNLNKYTLYLFLGLSWVTITNAQIIPKDSSTVKPMRLALVGGSTLVGLASAYIYVQNAWWKDNKKSFHFDDGPDYKYAKNLDKCGHFTGGLVLADTFHEGLEWAGVPNSKAYAYGFWFGTLTHIFIEIKDGFAPSYGFSVGDIAAGALGSALPCFQYKIPALRAMSVKFSYRKTDPYYYNMFPHADWNDDYMNQTYWASFAINDWMSKGSIVERIWPDFLTIAFGLGVDNHLNLYYTGQNLEENKGKGHYEFYASLDVDWRKIIPQKTKTQRTMAKMLNYIKIPLPTLRIKPNTQAYWWFL